MRLSEINPGQKVIITKILGHGAFRKRVMEMGFVAGHQVTVLLNAPLQDPVKYSIMDYEVSLRRAEASLIEVETLEKWNSSNIPTEKTKIKLAPHESNPDASYIRRDKVINVALLGNPNCGKTTLFNIVSGAHEHVGNYAGVTVDAKEGSLNYKGYRINIVDLPGTYSLSAYSPEEKYVLRYLKEETPDVIVNVVVASNLERNLYLTSELIDMNRSLVVALNMYDELVRNNIQLDYESLSKMLGVPMVPTVASSGKGIKKLLDTIIQVYELKHPHTRHIHVSLRPEIERVVNRLNSILKEDTLISNHFSPRYVAIKFLEKDPEIEEMLKESHLYEKLALIRNEEYERLKKENGEDPAAIIAAEKYGFIHGALLEVMEDNGPHEEKTTKIIDSIVTNKLFGFPIFLLIMLLMFWATFQLGSYPMNWIESAVSWISELIGNYLPEGPFKDLLLNGIIGGVGGVIVFLPNILILYAFISFMEDSGYMARVAFIMDKIMHRMGLHGKSFIPLVMGFGCNVPAIMSTRIIESRSSRLITILINPFISCSARIPIYVLLVGAFFPRHGAIVFFCLYLLGILVAVFTAKLLRKFWFKKDETPFVMELPPYRVPTMKSTFRNMWAKAQQYLQKMGGIILVASIIIWALSYFPVRNASEIPASYVERARLEFSDYHKTDISQEKEMAIITKEYQQKNSFLGKIGSFCEPVMKPLGFDWKIGVSLIAGASAKEVVVSTLGVIYVGDDDYDLLSKRLKTPSRLTGQPPFTPLKAIVFMVFVLLYFPCIASIVAIVKETKSWKYGLFSVLYNTALAWCVSFIVYRIGLLLV